MVVKKGNVQLLNSINTALKVLNEDGNMADILSTWRGKRVVYLNDTYEHLAGDQCLKNVADVIKDTVKSAGDFVACFGGEKFAILLYSTSEDDVAIVAEKMRSKIENIGNKNKKLEKAVKFSFGVTVMVPDKDLNPKNLIDAADQALYQAKKEGRNRVIQSSSLGKK